MSSASNKLELAFWAVIPAVFTALLLVVYLAPKHMSGLGSFMPLLFVIPMFYWRVNEPRDMPYWFVFAVGLVMDSTNGQPLGLTSLLNVVFLAMVEAQHKYIAKEGFMIKWGYFAALLAAVETLHWLLLFFFYARVPTVLPAAIQWFFTVCCYPLLHQLCEGLYRYISQQRWHSMHGR